MAAVLDRDAGGDPVRKAGVMGVVRVGNSIRVELPPEPRLPLRSRG